MSLEFDVADKMQDEIKFKFCFSKQLDKFPYFIAEKTKIRYFSERWNIFTLNLT